MSQIVWTAPTYWASGGSRKVLGNCMDFVELSKAPVLSCVRHWRWFKFRSSRHNFHKESHLSSDTLDAWICVDFIESCVGFVDSCVNYVLDCVDCADVLGKWGITQSTGQLLVFLEICKGPSAFLRPALAIV